MTPGEWIKGGRIYAPGKPDWAKHYGLMPTPAASPRGDRIRVYFLAAGDDCFGRVAFIEVDADNPSRVAYRHPEPVLDLGEDGAFDDCGVAPSCLLDDEGRHLLYTVGFQRCEKTPLLLFAGLARREENGENFVRVSRAPILPRTASRPFMQGAPCVLKENNEYRMWHWFVSGWKNSRRQAVFRIPYRTRFFARRLALGNARFTLPFAAKRRNRSRAPVDNQIGDGIRNVVLVARIDGGRRARLPLDLPRRFRRRVGLAARSVALLDAVGDRMGFGDGLLRFDHRKRRAAADVLLRQRQRQNRLRLGGMEAGMNASFEKMTYDSFRRRAQDESLSTSEKIGFPDEYRAGKAEAIFADIRGKLPAIEKREARVADIGCGMGELTEIAARHCAARGHLLFLLDSSEMLSKIRASFGIRVAGKFPAQHADFLAEWREKIDAVLCYSVLQHVALDGEIEAFFDASLSLLAAGGSALFGDIPNISMRNRFFRSTAGIAHHRAFAGDNSPPPTQDKPSPGQLDDAQILALVKRARGAGFHAFILPQRSNLPMANRREDLLIVRP